MPDKLPPDDPGSGLINADKNEVNDLTDQVRKILGESCRPQSLGIATAFGEHPNQLAAHIIGRLRQDFYQQKKQEEYRDLPGLLCLPVPELLAHDETGDNLAPTLPGRIHRFLQRQFKNLQLREDDVAIALRRKGKLLLVLHDGPAFVPGDQTAFPCWGNRERHPNQKARFTLFETLWKLGDACSRSVSPWSPQIIVGVFSDAGHARAITGLLSPPWRTYPAT